MVPTTDGEWLAAVTELEGRVTALAGHPAGFWLVALVDSQGPTLIAL